MESILVSVIIPAYNAEKYIAETIESVQKQTYSQWEMLITDDGSTDRTADIIREYAEKDARIQYLYQSNGRQGKARNLAIKNARGVLLAFLDADDLWTADKLSEQVPVFEREQVDLVYTSGYAFEGSTENLKQKFEIPAGTYDPETMFHKLLNGYCFPNLSVMVKKEKLLSIGGFDEDLRLQNAEDYQMWLRLADSNCLMYGLDKPLFFYRLHEAQVTVSDRLAIAQALWATHLAKLLKISESAKRQILLKRLNRYMVHYIDDMDKKRIQDLINLYKAPLSAYFSYLLNKILLLFGAQTFKKFHYRFTDLTL